MENKINSINNENENNVVDAQLTGMTKEPVKVCKICGQELPLSEFNKNKSYRDGHDTRCKKCLSEIKKQQKAAKKAAAKGFVITKPQPGIKATLSLGDFTNEQLCAELRRRGFNGEIRQTVTLAI